MPSNKTDKSEKEKQATERREELLRLVEMLATKGISQETMALSIGYSKNAISDMLTPTGDVSAKFLKVFKAHYFGNSEKSGSGVIDAKDQSVLLISKAMEDVGEIFKKLSANLNSLIADTQRTSAQSHIKDNPDSERKLADLSPEEEKTLNRPTKGAREIMRRRKGNQGLD